MNDPTPRCQAGDRCRAYDRAQRTAAELGDHPGPLCRPCLTTTERDIRALPRDYADLEQQLPKSLGQWSDGQPRGGGDPPIPLRADVEALQRSIWWVTTVWAATLRTRERLSPPPTGVRDYTAVSAAVAVLAPRVDRLAALGPTERIDYPAATDPEVFHLDGEPHTSTTVTGVQAVLDLCWLHQRARSALGLTTPVHRLPGICPDCHADEQLRRDVRGKHSDTVTCDACGTARPYDDYERYLRQILWGAAA